MKTLIRDARVLTAGGELRASVGIDGGKIAFISGEIPKDFIPERTIEARGDILSPGFVNSHCHLPMTLLRGVADDLNLQKWLFEEIFPREDKLDGEMAAVGARATIAECLSSGITSVSDMYFFCEDIAKEVLTSGIKANLARGLTGYADGITRKTHKAFAEQEALLRDWHMADGGRIRADIAIHAEYTSSPALWRDAAEFAAEHGIVLQTHISETAHEHAECMDKYGKTPTELFLEAGVFASRVNAAHCVHVSDEDIHILASHGAAVTHCPVSNAKLASGIAPVEKMLKAGLHVALGTDGASSNNAICAFGEMKCAALVAKLRENNPVSLSAETTHALATAGGAYAQGREAECGRIAVGMDADLVLLDARRPCMIPLNSPYSALVYSADNTCVRMTMVRGRVLYENGELLTIDRERLFHDAERIRAYLA
ncbi:MAG: amidohydrolase [Clostridia bacterium]|nr:amidohydrolase [Clostridia bacterium]